MVAFLSILAIVWFGVVIGMWGKVMDKCLDANIKANEMKKQKKD